MSVCPKLTYYNGINIPLYGLGTYELSNYIENIIESYR